MIRNQKHEKQVRLQSKTLDATFSRLVQQGLNCSPFEAEMITGLVHTTYLSDKATSGRIKPGQMVLTVTSELEGARKKIKEASTVSVVITVEDPTDVAVREKEGVSGLRRHRLVRICQETLDQGGLLTVEDLAHRIFNVGERTIVRDLAELRKTGIIVPLRSTIRDIGRTVSHKEEIVRLWLLGNQYDEIGKRMHHSVSAVRSYISTFKRIIALDTEGHTRENIAFVAGTSILLVKSYLFLWKKLQGQVVSIRRQEVLNPLTGSKPVVPASVPMEKKGGQQ